MRRAVLLAAVAVGTLVLCLLVWQVRVVVVLFGLGLVTSAAMRPFVAMLERRGLPRALALLIPYLGALVLISLVIYVLGGALISELGRAGDDVLGLYEHIQRDWPHQGGWRARLAATLPARMMPRNLGAMVGSAAHLTLSLAMILGQVVAVLVFALYWEAYRHDSMEYFLGLMSPVRRRRVRELWLASLAGAGCELRDLALKSLLALLLAAGSFRVAGMSYWALPACAVAVARLLPFVGVLGGMAAAALAGYADGPVYAGVAAGIALAVHVVVSHGVHVHGRRKSGPNPVLLLLSAMLLASAYGVWGLIAAPLVAGALQPLLEAALAARARPLGGDLAQLERRVADLRAQKLAPEVDSLLGRLEDLVAALRDPPAHTALVRGKST